MKCFPNFNFTWMSDFDPETQLGDFIGGWPPTGGPHGKIPGWRAPGPRKAGGGTKPWRKNGYGSVLCAGLRAPNDAENFQEKLTKWNSVQRQQKISNSNCYICHRSTVISARKLCAPRSTKLGESGWELSQSKAHPRLPNTSQYKVVFNLPPFGRNWNVKLWSPNSTLTLGSGWT